MLQGFAGVVITGQILRSDCNAIQVCPGFDFQLDINFVFTLTRQLCLLKAVLSISLSKR